MDSYGHPRLSRKDAHAIVKFLLPMIDLKGEKKMKDLGTMKACMQWLGKIARGKTWDEHMAAAADETYAKWESTLGKEAGNNKNDAPLFEIGGV